MLCGVLPFSEACEGDEIVSGKVSLQPYEGQAKSGSRYLGLEGSAGG